MSKSITWEELEAKLSPSKTLKKRESSICPVCGGSRNKGNHTHCSKITRMKYLKQNQMR
ncbi:MAG: hypothetical protein ACXWFI_12605 [Methylobacter sp.]